MLLPRVDSSSLSAVAAGLGLIIANYKPIPQLPKATSGSSFVAVSGHKYQTASANETADYPFSNTTEYGVTSTLYLPVDDSTTVGSSKTVDNGNSFAASTVGNGACPLNTTTYVPTTTLGDPVFDSFDPVKANIMRYRQQIGVNLGGWFVAEAWMESTYMACAQTNGGTSEYALVSGFGTTKNGLASAKNYLEEHWDTWITEDDFKTLASKGVNTVRLPIGYWSVGPYFCANSTFEDYGSVYGNSWKYVARAIRWAAKYDIGVLVDLHGAYGSQNGQDHSGVSGTVGFFTAANMQLTTNLLTWLSWEISDVTNVIGIQLLNEPVWKNSLWPWYNSTMNAMRQSSKYAQTIPLYFHDAFDLSTGAQFTAARNDFIVQDNHAYFVYTAADTAESAQGHTSDISGSYLTNLQKQSAIGRRNLVIGEWSCALAPSSLASSTDKDADQKAYCLAQQNTYANASSGYFFWSYKLEGCSSNPGWCFTSALGKFLPSYLNVWGLSGYDANRKILLQRSSSTGTLSKIVAKIANLNVPGYSSSVASLGALKSIAASSFKVSTNEAAVEGGMAPLLASASADARRDLAVESFNSHLEREMASSGSLSARAYHHTLNRKRQTTSQISTAQTVGYSDGYLTSTYFAAAFNSTTPVSRLGFNQQYILDSWAARTLSSSSNYPASALGHYQTWFLNGVADAEKSILATINAATVS